MKFLIDDEEELCRVLAARTWTDHHFSLSDKKLQKKMQAQNAKEAADKFTSTLDGIMKTKSKPGAINWEYLRVNNPKRYAMLQKEMKKQRAGVA